MQEKSSAGPPAKQNLRSPWDPPPALEVVRAPLTSQDLPSSNPQNDPLSIVGQTFGKYRILKQIQRGGMGELFLAELVDRSSQVVLKRLLADFLDDEKYVEMFRSEARVMASLNHPNIVRVFDVPIVDGMQCLAMEYVHGRNIQQVLKRCRTLSTIVPPQIALYLAIQVLKGLHYAHTFMLADGRPLDLVHRDVTPGNVLVSFDGDVKITDFGIAKSKMSSVSTTVGVVKGTTSYLSPEQIRGNYATPRSDVFSCATVLTEILTGNALFDRGTVPPTLFAIVTGERPEVSKMLPFEAPKVAATIERALSTNPQGRFSSAAEFAQGLEEASVEVGSMTREGLGNFVRQLFHGTDDLNAFTEGGSVPGLNALDLTYLFEVKDPLGTPESATSSSKEPLDVERARSALQGLVPGAKPLDADQFDRTTPMRPQLIAPPIPSDSVPGAMLATFGKSQTQPVISDDIERVESNPFANEMLGPPAAAVEPAPKRGGFFLFLLGMVCGGVLVWAGLSNRPESPSPQPEIKRQSAIPKAPLPALIKDDVTPDLAPAETGYGIIDIKGPRGARVKIDGILLRKRVPIRNFRVESGHRSVKVFGRGYQKSIDFDITAGEHKSLN